MPFVDVVKARHAFAAEPGNSALLDGTRSGAIQFALGSLTPVVEVAINYEEDIAGEVELFQDFQDQMDMIRDLIGSAQSRLNDIVAEEDLQIPTYTYLP